MLHIFEWNYTKIAYEHSCLSGKVLDQGLTLGSWSQYQKSEKSIPILIPNFWDDLNLRFLNLGSGFLNLGLGFIFSKPRIGIGIHLPTPVQEIFYRKNDIFFFKFAEVANTWRLFRKDSIFILQRIYDAVLSSKSNSIEHFSY